MNRILPFTRRSLTDARHANVAAESRLLNGARIVMFVRLKLLVSLLWVLGAFCLSISAQDWKPVHDGVEYAHVDHKIGNDPVKINLLRIDLTKARLDVYHALDAAIGTETTSSMATRHSAVAAINAGFFRLDKSEFAGDPAGLLMIDGRLLSESEKDRATLVIANARKVTRVLLDNYKASIFLVVDEQDIHPPLEISGINRERKNGEVVIYDGTFTHRPTINDGDVEIWIRRCSRPKLKLRIGGAIRKCREVKIVSSGAIFPTDKPDFIVSVEKNSLAIGRWRKWIDSVRDRRKNDVILSTRLRSDAEILPTDETVDITNGVSQLIKNGRIDLTWKREKASQSFAETRHPRTAVAKLNDGKFVMITVDGRQPGVSVGMTLQEVAEYILLLGATDAMNLDGGGSTTMFLDGKVVNTPSDKEGERKVSDAILVTLRKNARASRR
jgi:exopolysaccharide biosynthesis protein